MESEARERFPLGGVSDAGDDEGNHGCGGIGLARCHLTAEGEIQVAEGLADGA